MLLHTERLYLRPFEEEDLPLIYRLLQSSVLDDHTTPFWIPRDTLWLKRKFLISTDNSSSRYKFGIFLKYNEEGKLIGFLDVFNIDHRNSSAELGIALFNKAFRKKKFGSECINRIITWCFNTLNLNRLSAKCFATNSISIRLFQKYSFLKKKGSNLLLALLFSK